MEWVEPIAYAVEGVGVAVIVFGALIATVVFGAGVLREPEFQPVFHAYRANLGRAILLGLEFLIAGDIMWTILVRPTLESVASLGLIVLIRTFLSFSLETEIEGQLPWHRSERRASS